MSLTRMVDQSFVSININNDFYDDFILGTRNPKKIEKSTNPSTGKCNRILLL